MTSVTFLVKRQAEAERDCKEKGNRLHKWINHYIQSKLYEDDDYTPPRTGDYKCKDQFIRWWKKSGLKPLLSEYLMSSEFSGRVGRLDLLARDRNGRIILIDFKRSQYPLRSSEKYYLEYTLEVNYYRILVEELTDYRVNALYLVRMHPDLQDVECVEVPNRSTNYSPISGERVDAEVTNRSRCRLFSMTPVLVALVGAICWLLS